MNNINPNGKKVAVIGSGAFADKDRLFKLLDKSIDKIKLIVSGEMAGADVLAIDWAKERGVPYLVFPPRWKDPVTGEHDKGAGFRRNYNILETADVILVFWDGKSKGTERSVEIIKKLNKPHQIYKFIGQPDLPEAPPLPPKSDLVEKEVVSELPEAPVETL